MTASILCSRRRHSSTSPTWRPLWRRSRGSWFPVAANLYRPPVAGCSPYVRADRDPFGWHPRPPRSSDLPSREETSDTRCLLSLGPIFRRSFAGPVSRSTCTLARRAATTCAGLRVREARSAADEGHLSLDRFQQRRSPIDVFLTEFVDVDRMTDRTDRSNCWK